MFANTLYRRQSRSLPTRAQNSSINFVWMPNFTLACVRQPENNSNFFSRNVLYDGRPRCHLHSTLIHSWKSNNGNTIFWLLLLFVRSFVRSFSRIVPVDLHNYILELVVRYLLSIIYFPSVSWIIQLSSGTRRRISFSCISLFSEIELAAGCVLSVLRAGSPTLGHKCLSTESKPNQWHTHTTQQQWIHN